MIIRDRLFTTFIQLCAIDSEPAGERLMADYMRSRLAGLGFTVTEDSAGEHIDGNAGNLHGRLEGTGPGEALFFCCHLDRVAPGVGVRARIEGEFLVGDGGTVLGADDAAGLAALLEALTVLKESCRPHPPLEVVLTVAEEMALAGVRHFDVNRITAGYGFVLDAAGKVGEIIIRAPEKVKFRAVFYGKSAHAGFVPEQGISAIQMAAVAISRMPLLRLDPETTVNIGSISASGATNIVPERCEFMGETRSLDPDRLKNVVDSMTATIASVAVEFGGRGEMEILECYPAYALPENTWPAIVATRAARRIGVEPRYTSTGGGSDANIFNCKGKETVVLSCGYERAHTTEERIALEQLALLAEWTLAVTLEPEEDL